MTGSLPAGRPVSSSLCTMSELVLPNDTNGIGNLMGGRLLHWMDVCAAISSQRHAGMVCVTASVDSVEFHEPILQSEIIVLESHVNRAFRSSMEIEINVYAENPRSSEKRHCNRAFYTFVAVGKDGKPVPVPRLLPGTEKEHERYEAAARRREFRLLLSGRMEPRDAVHVQDYLASFKA
ncbi:MAG: acyl-CoA thioesterase [Bacteroidetes bacterium CG12_big_fil_rev_8_21_14_0_65_60_17]|nr:MAG: acyl-CoA thioesterase [Bacteroidetes bacterium CG12_big_fil_rev_8_21_14_0_65_60_17]